MNSWTRDKRWWIAISLAVVTAIGNIDRQAMAVAQTVLRQEFNFTPQQLGDLGFAFLLAYGVAQLFSGVWIDRVGTKRGLSMAVALWSVAAAAHALATGFWSFFIARAALGLTEGPNLPAAFKAVAEWFPRAERSFATGIVTAGVALGLILAPPLIALLISAFGWHAAFIVPAFAGFVWLWFWRRQYYLPEAHPTISADERTLVLADRIETPAVAPRNYSEQFRVWRGYLRYRETWGLILGRFAADGAFYFFSFWLPVYLATERGFDILRIATVAWLPFLAADLGSLAGGYAGQRLIRRGWSVDRARKSLMWLGALGVFVALPVTSTESWVVALLLVSVAVFSIQVRASAVFPLAADIFPARDVATVWGMSAAAGSVGAALFQAVIGRLIAEFSYYPVFVIVALMGIAQAVIIGLMIRRVEPIVGRNAGVHR
jgi:MFS transporter, ACS family, hexuronate transporter